ncbi:50S ribosomal protein L25/general stress protein Ctc [Hahella sp. HN01]|uniref:50S ribosomal protein L25/general stress protein Ctc n=1 Tax=unclassified Hahella TaxID=2624107 RepID=UPI001C1F1050|nr:50S ribosomal protein L25/general stress protein Ctc [Hahella sp. HN01]MBU6954940.1 50S ribosomal protein L25/general stress protein Ctc [Hahella sp. HN01]
MSNEFSLNAEKRDVQGKGASRRLRRIDGKVPGIIYGGETAPVAISVSHNQLSHALQNEAFYSHILTLDVEGTSESVILKDLQRHPYKPIIMHADFLRVQKDQKLHVNVPLHFINEDKCEGVRQGGGSISHQQTEVEVVCLPANLPEFIEVDMTSVQVEQILHLSDLKLPEGVELAELVKGADHDLPVVSVHKPKGAKADEAEGEAEAE